MSFWPGEKPKSDKPREEDIGKPSPVPVDQLTRIANAASDAIVRHEEFEANYTALVLVNRDEFAGIAALGFDHPVEMFKMMVERAEAFGRTLGYHLKVVAPNGDEFTLE